VSCGALRCRVVSCEKNGQTTPKNGVYELNSQDFGFGVVVSSDIHVLYKKNFLFLRFLCIIIQHYWKKTSKIAVFQGFLTRKITFGKRFFRFLSKPVKSKPSN
jgi:hypothetical protein